MVVVLNDAAISPPSAAAARIANGRMKRALRTTSWFNC
jgi:hypothetical protein